MPWSTYNPAFGQQSIDGQPADVQTQSGSWNPYSNWTQSNPRNFGQQSTGVQGSTDYSQQQSNATSTGQMGNVFNELNQTYGLTDTYGSSIQQSFEQALSQALSQSQSYQQTGVNDPIGYLPLVMNELGGLTDQTSMGYSALADILGGNTPQFDPRAWQQAQQQAIGQSVGQAMSGPQVLGMGETDKARQAAFAAEAAGVPLAQASLDAQTQYDMNSLAARIQAGDTLSSARGDLVQNLLPTLTEYFGETATGAQTSSTQESSQAQSLMSNEFFQRQAVEELSKAFGESAGWDAQQTEQFAENMSETLATSFGSIFGTAAESGEGGGGSFVCTVLCHFGYITAEKIRKELEHFSERIAEYKWAARGYLAVGPAMAKWVYHNKWIAPFLAPYVNAMIDYVTNKPKAKWWQRLAFESARIPFSFLGMLGLKKSVVDSELLDIMKLYYNPINVDELYSKPHTLLTSKNLQPQ